jgi:hypothetical protein
VYNLPNDNYATLRFETYNDGLATDFNYTAGNPANYSHVGVGTSDKLTPLPCPDNGVNDSVLQRYRFIRTNRKGNVVSANVAFSFLDFVGGNPWRMNATGEAITEIFNDQRNGGYATVGRVYNSDCDVLSQNRSDALFVSLNNGGNVFRAYRYNYRDFEVTDAVTEDYFTDITRSVFFKNRYYACGYTKSPGKTDYLNVTALDSIGGIQWSRTLRLTKPNNNTIARYLQARGIVEDKTSGNILVVGVLRGLFDLNLSNPFTIMLDAVGNVLWCRTYDFGINLTNEFNSVIQIYDNNFLIGGTSDANSANAPNPGSFDMWLTKIDAAGNIIFSRTFEQYEVSLNNYLQSKGIDLMERTRFDGRSEYFITGPAFRLNDQQLISVYRVDSSGNPINNWRYNNSAAQYENGFAIDAVEVGLPSAGLAVFANTIDPPANPGQPFSFLMKTYFNGATCTNYCPSNPVRYKVVQPEIIDVTVEAKDFIQRTRLREELDTGITNLICNQKNISCGSNNLNGSSVIVDADYLLQGAITVNPSIKILPQPLRQNGILKVQGFREGRAELLISTATGLIVHRKTLTLTGEDQSIVFDRNGLPSGLYYVNLISNGTKASQQLFIE